MVADDDNSIFTDSGGGGRLEDWQLKVRKLFGAFLCRRDAQRLLFVVVKVARITWTFAFWDERRLNL